MVPPTRDRFGCFIRSDTSPDSLPIADARTAIFDKMHKANIAYMARIDKLRKLKDELRGISRQIQENRHVGANRLRALFHPQLIWIDLRAEYLESEVARAKTNLEILAEFHSYLGKLVDGRFNVAVDRFMATLNRPSKLAFDIYRSRCVVVKPMAQRPIKIPLPDPKDTYDFFFHPANKTGQILQRLSHSIADITYPDLEVIQDALFESARDKEQLTKAVILEILFDFGWSIIPYPYCPTFRAKPIPPVDRFVPKIFNPPFLSDECAMLMFGELGGRDWPLRSAVDLLFGLMILTNPFQIADQFFDVIQAIGKCVQRVLIHNGEEAKFVEIDFDQMFALMLVCIFTSGLSELPLAMTYSFNFREYAKADPHKQYAMSHMEGLCAHLNAIDYNELRKKSIQLQKDYSSAVRDPLFGMA
jgi:hypothetical protein